MPSAPSALTACAAIVSLSSTICDSKAPSDCATRRLVAPKAPVAPCGELLGELERALQQLLVLDHLVHQTPVERLGGARVRLSSSSSMVRLAPMVRGSRNEVPASGVRPALV